LLIKINAAIQGKLQPEQIGFTESLNTDISITQLIDSIQTIVNSRNKDQIPIFVDLKAAFDSVNREVLSFKLHKYGIPVEAINYLRLAWKTSSFKFEDRPITKINHGIPQGSVISPILFNIYIDDLIIELKKIGKIFAYADDLVIICNNNLILKTIQTIKKWSNNNDMEINLNKTKIPRINRCCPRKNKIHIKTGLEYVFKYLGCCIDGRLNMSS